MTTFFRNRFVELALMKRPLAINISNHYDEHDTLMLGLLGLVAFFHLPKMLPYTECWEGGFGFSFNEDSVHIHIGRKVKIFTYPWCNWQHVRHEVMLNDLSFVKAPEWNEEKPKDIFCETAPYHYIMSNGTIQTTQATYGVGEREWRIKHFSWLPIKRVNRCIDVHFAEEVGEKRGSWKGGVIGCGYEMKKSEFTLNGWEKPKTTLLRMMRERKFGR